MSTCKILSVVEIWWLWEALNKTFCLVWKHYAFVMFSQIDNYVYM